MESWSLFTLYRRILFSAVSVYVLIRVSLFLWNWVVASANDSREIHVLRRYLVTLIMRSRLRRFWFDLLQIGVLVILLGTLLRMH